MPPVRCRVSGKAGPYDEESESSPPAPKWAAGEVVDDVVNGVVPGPSPGSATPQAAVMSAATAIPTDRPGRAMGTMVRPPGRRCTRYASGSRQRLGELFKWRAPVCA